MSFTQHLSLPTSISTHHPALPAAASTPIGASLAGCCCWLCGDGAPSRGDGATVLFLGGDSGAAVAWLALHSAQRLNARDQTLTSAASAAGAGLAITAVGYNRIATAAAERCATCCWLGTTAARQSLPDVLLQRVFTPARSHITHLHVSICKCNIELIF